jgi:hypothetical protein
MSSSHICDNFEKKIFTFKLFLQGNKKQVGDIKMKYIWYENFIPHVWKTFNLCKFNELLSRQIVHTKSHPLRGKCHVVYFHTISKYSQVFIKTFCTSLCLRDFEVSQLKIYYTEINF